MNATQFLLNFADKIEQKEIINQATAVKIRGYIRKLEDSTPIEIFLIVSGLMGALFCSAGIFSLASQHWDDYPRFLQVTFSLVPVLVGLYFYYRALFHHKESRAWIEASSFFLMLMIGASIALVGQTYQLDRDYSEFIKAWAILSLPLFYFARASGITILYLGLITSLVIKVSFDFIGIPDFTKNDHYAFYWYLIIGYLPHYYFSLKKESKVQGIRVVYMSYILYFSVILALLFTLKGNFLLWITAVSASFYLIGKRFMGENPNIFLRPFQLFGQLGIVYALFQLSNRLELNYRFEQDSFINLLTEPDSPLNEGKMLYFVLLLVVLAVLYAIYFYFRKQLKEVSKLVLFTPAFIFLMMLCHEYFFPDWLVALLINGWLLGIGFQAMIKGSENQNLAQTVYGFLLIAALLWMRYFDLDWHFILKGLTFLFVGGIFFAMNRAQKGKFERIQRNKTRRDEY